MIAALGPAGLAALVWLAAGDASELASLLDAPHVALDAAARDDSQVEDQSSPGAKGNRPSGEQESKTQEPKPTSEESAQKRRSPPDDELLEGLEKELMDDLEKELFEGLGQEPNRPNESESRDDAFDELDEQLLRELDEDEDLSDENPLSRIGRQMRRVEERIAEARTGEDTRTMQRRIVEELDKLLEMARRRQSQSSQSQSAQAGSRREQVRQPGSQASSGRDSQKPASDSTPRRGQAEAAKPDPQSVRKLLEDLWGHLPERERERVMNSTIEQFLPFYEQLIEQYFKRLAEELRDEP